MLKYRCECTQYPAALVSIIVNAEIHNCGYNNIPILYVLTNLEHRSASVYMYRPINMGYRSASMYMYRFINIRYRSESMYVHRPINMGYRSASMYVYRLLNIIHGVQVSINGCVHTHQHFTPK